MVFKQILKKSHGLIGGLLLLALMGCKRSESGKGTEEAFPDSSFVSVLEKLTDPVPVDLDPIHERGRLIALTRYNANSYFIYRGQPMGFEYELLTRLAEHLGVRLEIRVPATWDSLFILLYRGEGDIIAANLTVTKERAKKVAFTDHLTTTRQVLVQRKPEGWRKMKLHEIEKQLIRSPIDLIGRRVHVRRNSAYYTRLVHLSEELGGDIEIVAMPEDLETEDLIRMVARGEIDYTVADENIALINQAYYADIDVQMPLGVPQRIAWAVRPNAPQLLQAINGWLRQIKSANNPTFNLIYNKYYKNRRAFRARMRSEFFSKTGGKISPYDDLIRQYADSLGWDWRLLASQMYQESQFDPQARSWAGAVGLMQVLPRTARQYGITRLSDPQQNLAAAVRQLEWLWQYWQEIQEPEERIKFVLASYNAGHGHIRDAQRLAQKYGRDPLRWDGHVEYFILQKSKENYFTDPVVQFGYCRGEEPVNYVREILERYEHYKRFIP